MFLSKKVKYTFIFLLILLNIILRFQVVPHEIGVDSFETHIMVNSLNEYGYAKWVLHPLSFFGLYPASYTSSLHFLLSGLFQFTGIEMNSIIFLYCVLIGILSMFTAYLMAGEIINDDIFKLLAAFCYSVSPALLGYTTWTIATRPLLIVLTPLLIYLLLRCRTSMKYVPLTFIMAVFLFGTHHLFYFLATAFISFFILITHTKLKDHIMGIKLPEQIIPFVIVGGFLLMYSIPFFTGRFMEGTSRYSPFFLSYIRYTGILIVPAIGGLGYLILKRNKSFVDWFLLLTIMFIVTFIYHVTYMKWFFPIFILFLASIGLRNIVIFSAQRKYVASIFVIFMFVSLSFSGYYQFLHDYDHGGFFNRQMEESTYKTGNWMKHYTNGSAISNDAYFGSRIFATSETIHLLVPSLITNQIYGFTRIDMLEFERYPITDEEFWFSGYKGGPDREELWADVNRLYISPDDLNITYVVENAKSQGNVVWTHGWTPSKILHQAYDEGILVYDCKDARVWKL